MIEAALSYQKLIKRPRNEWGIGVAGDTLALQAGMKGSNPLSSTKIFTGKKMKCKKGEKARIRLQNLGTNGYVWHINESEDYKLVKKCRRNISKGIGGGWTDVFIIESLTDKLFEVRVFYQRTWESRPFEIRYYKFND
jgi:predicted secreted protein